MMISSASSQQRLSDSTVIVPIKSLKNALLVKTDRDNLKKELVVARDSISSMEKVILRQDTALFICDTTRLILEDKVKDLKGIITSKDGMINERDKKITDLEDKIRGAKAAFLIATIGLILSLAL
jgi:hypothetical protein